MFHPKLTIHGCGRTDAGVHATNYFAHFITEKEITVDLVYKLNRMLPNDIVIKYLLPVTEKANAQLDAISRTYDYHIHLTKNPFLVGKSACYDTLELDLAKMEKATTLFSNYTNFYHFCLQPDLHNHTNCQLSVSNMFMDVKNNRIRFQFKADRFLRGMIRITVGRILDVGRGQVSLAELEQSLQLKQPNRYMSQAYPQGLYLTDVEYPKHIFL